MPLVRSPNVDLLPPLGQGEAEVTKRKGGVIWKRPLEGDGKSIVVEKPNDGPF